MSIRNWIMPARRDAEVAQAAIELTQRLHQRVWERLAMRAGTLGSVAEARGYIRCRSQRELQLGLQAPQTPSGFAAELEERVLERALDLLVGQFVGAMVKPAPAPVYGPRAA